MRQLWFGIGLLVFLLICGIWLGNLLEDAYVPAAKDLEKAADCVLEGDWDLACALLSRAERNWQSRQKLTAALVHHNPLDRIDILFSQADVCRASRNAAAFAAACAELSQQFQALPQSNGFSWWNLL